MRAWRKRLVADSRNSVQTESDCAACQRFRSAQRMAALSPPCPVGGRSRVSPWRPAPLSRFRPGSRTRCYPKRGSPRPGPNPPLGGRILRSSPPPNGREGGRPSAGSPPAPAPEGRTSAGQSEIGTSVTPSAQNAPYTGTRKRQMMPPFSKCSRSGAVLSAPTIS